MTLRKVLPRPGQRSGASMSDALTCEAPGLRPGQSGFVMCHDQRHS